MIEAIINITVGITLFVGINALIKFKKVGIAESLCWFSLAAVGINLQANLIPSYFLPLLIPIFLRMQVLTWTERKNNLSQIFGSVISIAIVYLAINFSPLGYYLLGIIFTIEVFMTTSLIRKVFRRRGITSVENVGKKIAWIRSYHAIIILLLTSIIGYVMINEYMMLQLTIGLYASTAVLTVIRYSIPSEDFVLLSRTIKYSKSNLDQSEKLRILQAINQQAGNGFHLNPEASLKNLADSVKASTHAVSQAINEDTNGSFFEWLAVHRVQDAKKLLKSSDYQHYKIEQIAEEVGYLSKSAFNTAFKKITKLTPSEFRDRGVREDKVERSTDREIAENMAYRDTFGYIKISTAMLANFFKLYFRNLNKNRVFSVLNLSGLIIGFTSCILIFLFLTHELSYDKFHDRSEDIYRITLQATNPQTRTPHPMAQGMVNDFAAVESAVTLTPLYGPGLTLQSIYLKNPENNVMFQEPDGYGADSTFFDMFDFKLISGDEKTALRDVGSIVISESMAKKYFGDEDPLGKAIEVVADDVTLMIRGVMEEPPSASHFHPRFIVSYTTLKYGDPDDAWFTWSDPGHFNYIKLQAGADAVELESQLPKWIEKVSTGVRPEMLALLLDGTIAYTLQPIESIHLHSNLRWELESNSSATYIYILFGAVLFIMIILTINYINLSTARAYERSREVGVRKVLGASKLTMSIQFVMESMFTCLMAMILSFGAAYLLLDDFNNLTTQQFSLEALLDIKLIAYAILMIVTIGFLSGFFPSIGLNKIKSVEVLKGKILQQKGGSWKRSVLVGVQFTVSTVMIFGSIIILKQVKFLETRSMGFDREALMVLKLPTEDLERSNEQIKSELLKLPGVLSAGTLSNLPGEQFNQNQVYIAGDDQLGIPCSELWVDYDGLQTLGLTLNDGRLFDQSFQQDSSGNNFILNQIAIDQLNLENPIGSTVIWNSEDGPVEGRIVGIVDNFNFKSLHEPIRPILIMVGQTMSNVVIRINTQNVPEAINRVTEVYRQFDEEFVPDISFLDERLNLLYTAERNSFKVFNLFSTIALALAAMGLLGLAYLIITQRTKEIGIRKVLGARLIDILWLENKSFLKIIVFAVILGIPLSILAMNQWLNEFAYRTPFGVSPYLVTIATLAFVAIGSVTFAVLRTVLKNPSEALRYE